MVVTKARAIKTTTAGTAVPMHSIAGDAGTTVMVPATMRRLRLNLQLRHRRSNADLFVCWVDRAAADAAPLIDGATGWIGVRMSFALTAWRRSPLLKETQMSERLETLKKARERMLEDRDMHAKVLAAPFDRDKAERARNKFIEIQTLIDALDRAIGGEGAH
jgi:hypothetical protein